MRDVSSALALWNCLNQTKTQKFHRTTTTIHTRIMMVIWRAAHRYSICAGYQSELAMYVYIIFPTTYYYTTTRHYTIIHGGSILYNMENISSRFFLTVMRQEKLTGACTPSHKQSKSVFYCCSVNGDFIHTHT